MEEAKRIGRALIEDRLAACVNIFPIESIYRWEGIQESSEIGILAKTRADKVREIKARVVELHSYEVPCIVSWEIKEGSKEYLKWIGDSL